MTLFKLITFLQQELVENTHATKPLISEIYPSSLAIPYLMPKQIVKVFGITFHSVNLKFLQERLQFTINELGQKVSEILAASCSSDLTDRINRIKK